MFYYSSRRRPLYSKGCTFYAVSFERDELWYSQCINYALTNKALCYFERKPGMFWSINKLFLEYIQLQFDLILIQYAQIFTVLFYSIIE